MHQIVVEFSILLMAALAAVLAAVRLRLSPTVGYLLAGILVGPGAVGLVNRSEAMALLSELGIPVLMFFIGLEFSWSRLISERRKVFGFGGAQVALTAVLAGAVVSLFSSASIIASLLVGGAVAMSSTAMVHKHLVERGEGATGYGTTTTGALVLQDVVSLALLGVLAVLSGTKGDITLLASLTHLLSGIAILFVAALLARPTLGRVLAFAARTRSNEVFLIAVLAILLGAALGAEKIGLSLPLGAFAVGVILAESDFRHLLEDEIRPFRDLLLGVFFLATGMSLDLGIALAQPLIVIGGALAIIAAKFSLVWAIARISGQPRRERVRTALLLAHCGELSLLLLGQIGAAGLLAQDEGQFLLGMIALSMMLGAVIVHFSPQLAEWIAHSAEEEPDHTGEAEAIRATEGLNRHIILVGCGTIGRTLAEALHASGTPYVAIERDHERFMRARERGLNVIFGDGHRKTLLEAAGVDHASAVVLFLREAEAPIRLMTTLAERHNGERAIIASCRDNRAAQVLFDAGVDYVFPENLAAALALARAAMRASGMAEEQVEANIRALRQKLAPDAGLRDREMVEP